jgi:HEAT repeat protein
MGLSTMIYLIPVLLFAFFTDLSLSANQANMQISPYQQTTSNHILYLMHIGETAKALQAYQHYHTEAGHNDFELIDQIGLILLDQGYRTRDPEIQRLTLFGAGISMNEKALYILEDAMMNDDPELQLIALNLLSRLQHDRAEQAIHRAMGSNILLIRLEIAFKLALKKDTKAVAQTEALMAKVPEVLWPIFPQIYAASGSPEAKKILRKLMTHKDEPVRIATILSLTENGHDDFLPHIRRMLSHHGPAQQEACATALGVLKDESSANHLLTLTKNPNANVKLAALASLYRLGRHEVTKEIEVLATSGNIFAIKALGNIPGTENTLFKLIQQDNVQIKVNAAISLLKLRDPRSLIVITSLLLSNTRDYALGKISSQGTSLQAFKIVPSAQQNLEKDPFALELSLHMREDLLTEAVELPEREFIALANHLLDSQQNDLIPVLIEILQNHPTPAVIELLKKHQQKVGAPLIRNYCNLALYRLKESGPYAQNLLDWVKQQRDIDLIKFRPLVPIDQREKLTTTFELTPEETSRLLVDAFEAFASNQDDHGIDALISVIQTGNSKNKYALIGLLMRAIQ